MTNDHDRYFRLGQAFRHQLERIHEITNSNLGTRTKHVVINALTAPSALADIESKDSEQHQQETPQRRTEGFAESFADLFGLHPIQPVVRSSDERTAPPTTTSDQKDQP